MSPLVRRRSRDGAETPPAPRVLLHIGIPKSATTALQNALAAARGTLAGAGILYPDLDGRPNHHQLASQLLRHRHPRWNPDGDSDAQLDLLHEQIDARRPHTVVLSSELLCEAPLERARDAVALLGPDVEVLITLRSLPQLLPSSWQQGASTGKHPPFGDWLAQVLAAPESLDLGPLRSLRGDDGHNLVTRWTELVGADRITVMVPDPGDRSSVFADAEALLGIPRGTLPQFDSNPSLTFTQSEFARLTGAAARGRLNRYERVELIQLGLGDGMKHGAGERGERAALPRWAADAAARAGTALADEIRRAGLRVIGDLSHLSDQGPVSEAGAPSSPPSLPLSMVADGLAGVFRRGVEDPFARDDALQPVVRAPKVHGTDAAPAGRVTLAPLAALGRSGLVAAARAASGRLGRLGVDVLGPGDHPQAGPHLGWLRPLHGDPVPAPGGALVVALEPAERTLRRLYQRHLIAGGTQEWARFVTEVDLEPHCRPDHWARGRAVLDRLRDGADGTPTTVAVDDNADLIAACAAVEDALALPHRTLSAVVGTSPRATLLGGAQLALLREVNLRVSGVGGRADRRRLLVNGVVSGMVATAEDRTGPLAMPPRVRDAVDRFDALAREAVGALGLEVPTPPARSTERDLPAVSTIATEQAVGAARGIVTLAARSYRLTRDGT